MAHPLSNLRNAFWLLTTVAYLCGAPGSAQKSQGREPRFEVVSIRPSDPSRQNTFFKIDPAGGFRASAITLGDLIASAYTPEYRRILGLKSWAEFDRYDVAAKAQGVIPVDRGKAGALFKQRLASFLVDRCGLKFHEDQRELLIYALVVAKNGPKLKPAANGSIPILRVSRGELVAVNSSMAELAGNIPAGRVVLDESGIDGRFDFSLKWTPDTVTDAPAPDQGPSLFTALQEQLGLKLESSKRVFRVLVVDELHRPSDN